MFSAGAMLPSTSPRPVTPSFGEVLDGDEPPSPIDPRFAPRPPTPMPIDTAATAGARLGVAPACPASPMPPTEDALDWRYSVFEPIPASPHPFGALPQPRLSLPSSSLPRHTLRPQHSCSSISTFAQAQRLAAPAAPPVQADAIAPPAPACASSAASRDVPVPTGLDRGFEPVALPLEWHGLGLGLPATALGHSIPAASHALLDRLVALVLMPITVPLLFCVFSYCAWTESKWAWHSSPSKGGTSTQSRNDLNDEKYDGHGPRDYSDLHAEPQAEVTDSDPDSDDSDDDEHEDDADAEAAVVHDWWRERFSGVDMARESNYWDATSPPPSPPIVRRTKDGLLDW